MNGYDRPPQPQVQLNFSCQAELLTTMKKIAEHYYGWPGAFVYRSFQHINHQHFDNELPVPMLEVTRIARCQVGDSGQTMRIYAGTLSKIEAGALMLGYDEVLHQCCHLAGYHWHNSEPYCALVNTLSPEIGLAGVDAQPTRCVRRGGRVIKTTDGSLTVGQLAAWPHSLRPPGFYEAAELPFNWRL